MYVKQHDHAQEKDVTGCNKRIWNSSSASRWAAAWPPVWVSSCSCNVHLNISWPQAESHRLCVKIPSAIKASPESSPKPGCAQGFTFGYIFCHGLCVLQGRVVHLETVSRELWTKVSGTTNTHQPGGQGRTNHSIFCLAKVLESVD